MLVKPFIKSPLSLVLLLVLLQACSSTPKIDESVDVAPIDEQPAESVSDKIIASPNPYLQNPKSVSDAVKLMYKQAVEQDKAGNHEQAAQSYRGIINIDPSLSGPYVNLGIQAFNKDDFVEAERLFKQAVQANKRNVDAYNWLAITYREQGKFVLAEKTWFKALDVWPHYKAAYKNLGIFYELYQGRLDDAIEQFKMYQRLSNPDDKLVKKWIVDLERRAPKMKNQNTKTVDAYEAPKQASDQQAKQSSTKAKPVKQQKVRQIPTGNDALSNSDSLLLGE